MCQQTNGGQFYKLDIGIVIGAVQSMPKSFNSEICRGFEYMFWFNQNSELKQTALMTCCHSLCTPINFSYSTRDLQKFNTEEKTTFTL